MLGLDRGLPRRRRSQVRTWRPRASGEPRPQHGVCAPPRLHHRDRESRCRTEPAGRGRPQPGPRPRHLDRDRSRVDRFPPSGSAVRGVEHAPSSRLSRSDAIALASHPDRSTCARARRGRAMGSDPGCAARGGRSGAGWPSQFEAQLRGRRSISSAAPTPSRGASATSLRRCSPDSIRAPSPSGSSSLVTRCRTTSSRCSRRSASTAVANYSRPLTPRPTPPRHGGAVVASHPVAIPRSLSTDRGCVSKTTSTLITRVSRSDAS